MSTLRNHFEESELEETLGELLSPTQEPRPQLLCLCLQNAGEHPGASLPFPSLCVEAEVMYIGEKDANDRDSNLGGLAWDGAGTLMPQFSLCSRCQGFGFFPWTAALKYLT